jgi:hypothetical protein
MSKKQIVKLTPDGLNLVTVLNYSNISEMNGFYNKEVFFTKGFNTEILSLFQAIGNLGGFPSNIDLNNEIQFVIVSNQIMNNHESTISQSFRKDFQDKLNQNNSPYRKIKMITEDQLVWYIENRSKNTEDKNLDELIKRYKSANKLPVQQELF